LLSLKGKLSSPSWPRLLGGLYRRHVVVEAAEPVGERRDLVSDGANGSVVPYYLAWPVVLSSKLPSTGAASTILAYFGDLRMAATLAARRETTVGR
jgi:hypothetical protein